MDISIEAIVTFSVVAMFYIACKAIVSYEHRNRRKKTEKELMEE